MSGNYGWNVNRDLIESTENQPWQMSEQPRNDASSGYLWRSFSGEVPADALRGGTDKDNEPLYIGRAFHAGEILPAKALLHRNVAYVAYNGEEIPKYEFEVLCVEHSNVGWTSSAGGQIPPEAVAGGTTSSGEPLFIGRVLHDGALTPGKIHPSHGVCYISYDGLELSFPAYEVLVVN